MDLKPLPANKTWGRRALRLLTHIVLPVLVTYLALEVILRLGLGIRLLPHLPPAWWLPELARIARIIYWLHVNTGLGLIIATLPIAVLLAVVAPRRGRWIATLATALVIAAHPILHQYMPQWATLKTLERISFLADLVKQALIFPLLTLLANRALECWRPGRRGADPNPDPDRRLPEGLALVVLTSLPGAVLLPAYALPLLASGDPHNPLMWTLLGGGAGLAMLAPLLAAVAMFWSRPPATRRIVLTITPILLFFGLVSLATLCAKPMILARITSPVLPPPGLWRPDVVGMGSWALLAADLLLSIAWLLAWRRRQPPPEPVEDHPFLSGMADERQS